MKENRHKLLFIFKIIVFSFFILLRLGFLEQKKAAYKFTDEMFKLFVAILCMYLFYPFGKPRKLLHEDYYFAFSSGFLIALSINYQYLYNHILSLFYISNNNIS